MNVEIVLPKNLVFDFVQCVTKEKEPVVDIWHFPPPPLQLPAAPPPDLILNSKRIFFPIFFKSACCLLPTCSFSTGFWQPNSSPPLPPLYLNQSVFANCDFLLQNVVFVHPMVFLSCSILSPRIGLYSVHCICPTRTHYCGPRFSIFRIWVFSVWSFQVSPHYRVHLRKIWACSIFEKREREPTFHLSKVGSSESWLGRLVIETLVDGGDGNLLLIGWRWWW